MDFQKRKSCDFSSVEYFLNRFSQHLSTEQADSIYDKFRLYQGLSEIPPEIDIQTDSDGQVRADVVWHGLKDINGRPVFELLSHVAKLVLVLPHSNADEEHVFSFIRKKKTSFRADLSLEPWSLLSLVSCNVNFNHIKCFEYEHSSSVLERAKSAAWNYNSS